MSSVEEVAGSLVVTVSDAAILVELVEELRDQVTCSIQVFVTFAQLFAAARARNDHVSPTPNKRSYFKYLTSRQF